MRRSAVWARQPPARSSRRSRSSICSRETSEMTDYPAAPTAREVELTIDGRSIVVAEGSTLLAACAAAGVETPTLCYLETLTPVNVCRVCVVEVEGSRVLVPACSRRVEAGMVVHTDSERVRHSRRMVLEFLGSSV